MAEADRLSDFDVVECRKCNASGEISISATTGRYVSPGPVPDDARGVVSDCCFECRGIGYVEGRP